MLCRMGDLRSKEVIIRRTAPAWAMSATWSWTPKTGSLAAVVVYGRLRLFGLLGREPTWSSPGGTSPLSGTTPSWCTTRPPPAGRAPGPLPACGAPGPVKT